jgi:hypothetical protein
MPSKRLGAAIVAAAALVVAACSPSPSAAPGSPSPTPGSGPSVAPPSAAASPGATEDATAVYELIRDQVEEIRGLQPTADVEPVTIDETQLLENLEAEIDAEQTPEQMALSEDLLSALGLIPQGASIRELTLDLLAGQVAGYYSPDRDELFVVSRTGQTVGPVERVTYAHEFVHQLQDQTFELDSLATGEFDQSDRALAQLALIEGDASWVQTAWIAQNLTSAELGELLQAALDPEALAALTNAPTYLRETSLFPYQDGLALVQELIAGGDSDAIDVAFSDPPDSTEQVLHPNKYLQREEPIEVRIPGGFAGEVGAGWSEAARDTLGELILRIWLTEHGVEGPGMLQGCNPDLAACRATAGWGGDRLVLLRADDGSLAVALKTTWDSADDALEFAISARLALDDPGLTGEVFHQGGSRDVLIAIGDHAGAVLAALRD